MIVRIPNRSRSPETAPAADAGTEALFSIAVSLQQIVLLLKAERKEVKFTENDAMAWLIAHVQKSGSCPSLSDVSRLSGIKRRQLAEDRWPKFHELYFRLSGMERGVDKARMKDCHHDEESDQ